MREKKRKKQILIIYLAGLAGAIREKGYNNDILVFSEYFFAAFPPLFVAGF